MAAKLIYLTDEEFDILSKYLKMGGKNCDSTNLENKIIFMRDKFRELEMPTKQVMTRAEAIIFVTNRVFGLTDTGQAVKWVDFFIAAGMLEVKEEELPGLPIGFRFPFSKRDEWTNCCNEMFKQGFEVKKK